MVVVKTKIFYFPVFFLITPVFSLPAHEFWYLYEWFDAFALTGTAVGLQSPVSQLDPALAQCSRLGPELDQPGRRSSSICQTDSQAFSTAQQSQGFNSQQRIAGGG